MATGGFDPNCIVPVTAQVSVGTTAVPLKSSSSLAAKFTVTNPGAIVLYLGDSAVASTQFTFKIAAGTSVTFGPDEIIGARQKPSYDLARVFVRATATSQVATLTTYCKGGTTSPF